MLSPGSKITLLHTGGWSLFISLILGFAVSGPGTHRLADLVTSRPFISFCGIYLFVFYFNNFVLLPRLYLRKKYFFYFGAVLLLFLVVYYLKPFDRLLNETNIDNFSNNFQQGPPPPPPPGNPSFAPPPGPPPAMQRGAAGPGIDIVSIVLFIMVWLLGVAMQLIRQWQSTEQRAVRAEADKAQAELSFLKAQINPHFLFNTLNNIYSMAVAKAAETPDAIMKLSNIMRYVTDEVSSDFVPLESEIACISDYIELQQLRLNRKVAIDFEVGGDATGKQMAPLVLMTFVENAFKYGISHHEPSPVAIHIKIKEAELIFYCRNKNFSTRTALGQTGIGIENTRQRLQHLYGERHVLHIKNDNNIFTVELRVQLYL